MKIESNTITPYKSKRNTLGNIIWRNKIRLIFWAAKIMLRQNMLHQNNDTPIFFQHLKVLLCFRVIKILPKSDEREKNLSLPKNIRNIAKYRPFHAKIPMKFLRVG